MAAYSVDEVDNKTKAFRASVTSTATDSESAVKVSIVIFKSFFLFPVFGGYQLKWSLGEYVSIVLSGGAA